jgi:hypothetical protein
VTNGIQTRCTVRDPMFCPSSQAYGPTVASRGSPPARSRIVCLGLLALRDLHGRVGRKRLEYGGPMGDIETPFRMVLASLKRLVKHLLW